MIEDPSSGGWPAVLTDPEGNSVSFVGLSNDISAVIDPGTGMVVSGRSATLTLRLSSLIRASMSVPRGTHDSSRKPWRVRIADISGVEANFKVVRSDPDKTIGVVTMHLEAYRA